MTSINRERRQAMRGAIATGAGIASGRAFAQTTQAQFSPLAEGQSGLRALALYEGLEHPWSFVFCLIAPSC